MTTPLATTPRVSAETFGALNFGGAELGHVGRTRRLVRSADLILQHPGGTLPQKFRDPADLDGFYRLANRKEATHQAVLQRHRLRTLDLMRQAEGPVLTIHDTTELDYTGLTSLTGLGRIGKGTTGAAISATTPWPSTPTPALCSAWPARSCASRGRPRGKAPLATAATAPPASPGSGFGGARRSGRPGGQALGRRLRPRCGPL